LHSFLIKIELKIYHGMGNLKFWYQIYDFVKVLDEQMINVTRYERLVREYFAKVWNRRVPRNLSHVL
jgi:hypothetical protein